MSVDHTIRILNDLLDVDTTGLADGDTLVYDNATNQFKPGSGGGGTGGTQGTARLYTATAVSADDGTYLAWGNGAAPFDAEPVFRDSDGTIVGSLPWIDTTDPAAPVLLSGGTYFVRAVVSPTSAITTATIVAVFAGMGGTADQDSRLFPVSDTLDYQSYTLGALQVGVANSAMGGTTPIKPFVNIQSGNTADTLGSGDYNANLWITKLA